MEQMCQSVHIVWAKCIVDTSALLTSTMTVLVVLLCLASSRLVKTVAEISTHSNLAHALTS